MQRLIDILVAIFGLGKAAYDNIDLDEARDFHAKYIARAIWITAALVLVMVGINYAGYKGINIGISLFLSLVAITIFTRPEPIIAAVVAGLTSGAIQRPQTMIQEVRSFLKTFFRSLGDVIFWIAIFGMFLGRISCEGNPGAVASIAISLIVIGYGSYRWKMGPVLYKKVIYGFAIFNLLFSLVSLPSHAKWMHYAGFDPISILRTSDEEEMLAKIEEEMARNESEAKIAILKNIKKDLEAKRPLKDWQEAFVENEKKERDENSIPSKVTGTLSSISSPSSNNKTDAYVPPTPAPMPATQVVTAAPEPPAPKINISGDWSFDWNDPGATAFRVSQIGTNLSGKSNFPRGEMILKGSLNGTTGEGTWELIGHPAGHLQGRFYITSLTESAGEGKWVHNDGHTTRLIMKKV